MGPLVQSLLYGALALTYVYAIAAKPTPYRSLWSIPFTALILFIFFTTGKPAPGTSLNAYGLTSMLFTHLFQGLDYIVLTDVQKELLYYGRGAAMRGDAKPAPIYEADLWTRIKWSLRLITSPRAVGWTHEPASLRKVRKPKTTTRAFVISRLVNIARNVAIYDFAGVIMRANPYFSNLRFGTPIPAMLLWEICFWRVAYATHSFASIASMDSLHCLWAIGCVCSGVSLPNDFDPDLFGSFSDGWTVRRAWGKVWHQNLRPVRISSLFIDKAAYDMQTLVLDITCSVRRTETQPSKQGKEKQNPQPFRRLFLVIHSSPRRRMAYCGNVDM